MKDVPIKSGHLFRIPILQVRNSFARDQAPVCPSIPLTYSLPAPVRCKILEPPTLPFNKLFSFY